MNKGIVYIMTSIVPGLIKIGMAGTENYKERMRFLEANGYSNVPGLKRFFATELNDYINKEKLLHEIFSEHQVGSSELFALDQDMVKQLLLSFEGTVIYPENIEKEKVFEEIATIRKQSALFSFYRKGLKDGDQIYYVADTSIIAKVISEREVEYKGESWKLSPLTRKIYEEKNQLNSSGAYQGAAYWSWNNTKLKDLPDLMG